MSERGRAGAAARARARAARDAANRAAARFAEATGLGHYVVLDYPASAREPGGTRPAGRLHDLVAAGEGAYAESLRTISSYADDLARIPVTATEPNDPSWVNDFQPGLDSAAIYTFIRSREPATYLEVGSGTSTRFARRAIADGGLATRIVSIDPDPRAEIDAICDQVVRSPLESADPALLAGLGEGDVLFLDGSHRVFDGSDATVFFCDLLPELAPGVLVGIHDVYLPDDYPADVAERHYSEQYLLAALLLGEPEWIEPVLAADYVSKRPALASALDQLWDRPGLAPVQRHGVAFWLRTAAR